MDPRAIQSHNTDVPRANCVMAINPRFGGIGAEDLCQLQNFAEFRRSKSHSVYETI